MGSSEQYPAINAFVRGYLHQDVVAEYGSADRAAEDFCRDADKNQLNALRAEWESFRTRHCHLEDINQTLSKLGSIWQFDSTEEFRRMINIFHKCGGAE